MSIADQVQRLNGVKADIIEAIKGKGVDVPSGTMLDECPGLISSISGGGGDVSVSLANIMPTTGIKVVDGDGYIGGNFLGAYYPNTSYYNNFAIKVEGADFSGSGLGSVTFVDRTATIGGRVYRTVTIGGKTWLAENLDFKFSGCALNPTGNPTTPAYWYYDRNESLYGIDGNRHCGLLYNWHAIKLLTDNRADLVPGWHVPSTSEWNELTNSVGGSGVAGTRLKSLNNVSTDGTWPTGWNGSDDYGFGVVPAGYYNSGSFYNANSDARVWTSSERDATYGYQMRFVPGSSITTDWIYKQAGCSVRLVKD